MKKSTRRSIVAIAITLLTSSAAADSIGEIFTSNSEWEMFVDGWQGTAVVKKHSTQRRENRNNNTFSSIYTIDFKWQKHDRKMVIREDQTGKRTVEFSVRAPNGDTIKGQGALSDFVVKVMAGTTQTVANGGSTTGAWYAKRIKEGRAARTGNAVSSESKLKTKAVIDMAPQIASSCRLTVSVSGTPQDVKSIWVQPDGDRTKSKEYAIGSNGRFNGSVPSGALTVTLVAKGKVSLVGEGLAQRIQCPPGGQKSIAARVDGISE
jgi:hypothetical protein